MEIKKKFYRWMARRKLLNRYQYLNEVNALMEEDTTAKILEGGSAEYLAKGRDQLIKLQAEIKEYNRFINFLKKTR